MSGPWELFQAQSASAPPPDLPHADDPDGPWKLFAPAAAPPSAAPMDTMQGDVAFQRSPTAAVQPTPAASRDDGTTAPPAPTGDNGGFLQQLDAGVRAAANGMTLGLADRAAAAFGALTGIGGQQGDYAGNLAGQQTLTKLEDAKYPVTTTAAGLAGAVAMPGTRVVKAIAEAPTLLGKVALGTGIGTTEGAVQGAAGSEDMLSGQGAKDAAIGALGGGTIGAALPAVASGVGAGYRALAGGTNLPPGVTRAAATKVAEALQADAPGVANLPNLGPDALLPDAGPSLLGLAQGVATKPGQGRTVLVDALTARNAGTNARVQGDIDAALGPARSPSLVADNLKAVRSGVHDELPAVFDNAPPVDITPTLTFIGQRLDNAVGPEKAALTTARNYLMEQAPNGSLRPVTSAEKVANAKTALQGLVDYGDPSIGVPPGALAKAAGATKNVLASLNGRLRDHVPGYASVMDRSSNLARTIDAIEEGQGVLRGGEGAIRPDDFARRVGGATDAERRGLQMGTRAAIDRSVGTKINDLQALRQDLQGEGGWNERKIALLFGQKPAADLAASVERNARFRDTFGKVVDNSQTAQRTAASQALDDAVKAGPLIPKNVTTMGFLANGIENAFRAIAEGRADFEGQKTRAAIGRILATPASAAREQELLKILSRSHMIDRNGKRIGNAAALLTSAAGLEVLRQRSTASKAP